MTLGERLRAYGDGDEGHDTVRTADTSGMK